MYIKNEKFIEMIKFALKKFAESTQLSYLAELMFFAKFLGNKPLAAAMPTDAMSYFQGLHDAVSCHDGKPLASKTIRRKILSLYSIYDDAFNLDLMLCNPFEKVAKFARQIRVEYKREPRHIEFNKVKFFVNKSESLRDKAIFAVLFGGGLRVSELLKLKLSDITYLNDSIGLKVKNSKKPGYRPVTLPAWASTILADYLPHSGQNWLFPSPIGGGTKALTRKWVSNLVFETFGLRAHGARHTHISYLLSKGLPIYEIARAVGHDSITSTMIYDRRSLDFNSCASIEADYFI